MATSNIKIYERAISSFDDPAITKAYLDNPTQFFQIMNNYLKNAIPLYNNPLSILGILSDRIEPYIDSESFVGDGNTNTYVLSSTPLQESYFTYYIDNVETTGNYDELTNSVTFPVNIPLSQIAIAEWYYVGQFNQDLTDVQQRILAYLLVANWAEKEKNFLLDIRRLLNDTDYKIGSEANSARAKVNWYQSMIEEADKLMNTNAWIGFFKQRLE